MNPGGRIAQIQIKLMFLHFRGVQGSPGMTPGSPQLPPKSLLSPLDPLAKYLILGVLPHGSTSCGYRAVELSFLPGLFIYSLCFLFLVFVPACLFLLLISNSRKPYNSLASPPYISQNPSLPLNPGIFSGAGNEYI